MLENFNKEIQSQQSQQSQPAGILDPSKILLDVEFIAELLGEVTGTIYNKAPFGLLPFPCYKIGRNIRFKYSDVMEWVDNLQPMLTVRTKKPIKQTPPPKPPPNTIRGRGRPAGTTKAALKLRSKHAASAEGGE